MNNLRVEVMRNMELPALTAVGAGLWLWNDHTSNARQSHTVDSHVREIESNQDALTQARDKLAHLQATHHAHAGWEIKQADQQIHADDKLVNHYEAQIPPQSTSHQIVKTLEGEAGIGLTAVGTAFFVFAAYKHARLFRASK
ncbi:MAG: hypothetical protein WA843_01240 [Candidatus Saccharimonadales bacterium]